jgi:hypothetical protein
LKPRGTLLAVAAVVLLAGGAGLWYFMQGDQPATAPAGTQTERRIAIAPKIPGVLLVNDARDTRLGAATPMFVECVLTNPSANDLAVTPATLLPEVRDAAGAPVPVTWERVGDIPTTIAAGTSVGLRWIATSRLPPGDYTVVATGERDAAAAGAARVLVDPARLTVLDTTDAALDEAAAIQLLAWRGQSTEALTRIEAALVASPDSLVLQLWRGDLLRELGRTTEAADQFTRLARAIDARQRARAGAEVELPFWLAERMAGR